MMGHISPLVELDQEEEDLRIEIEEEEDIDEEEEEEEKEDDEDVYKDLELSPEVSRWINDNNEDGTAGKTVYGIKVMDVPLSATSNYKRYDFDLCPICLKPWTLDITHHLSTLSLIASIHSLPCGHMFGMSCLKKWINDYLCDECPQCHQKFSLESVRLLYVPRLCIPATAAHKAYVRRYTFSKLGFTRFKEYVCMLRTDALNKRSDVLKLRANVLGRQNDAMNQRTELLNRMARLEKRVDVLERHIDAMKRQTQLLNRVTEEEDWAEAAEQQADAEKRAEVFRRKAGAVGHRADEYLRKADAFGQQAKALRQQAKSLRQLADSYLASRKFYIQRYKKFLSLSDNKITK